MEEVVVMGISSEQSEYYKQLDPASQRVDDLLQLAIGDALDVIIDEIPQTPQTLAALIGALASNAAGAAISNNIGQDEYLRICRQMYARAMAATRRVNAEDGR